MVNQVVIIGRLTRDPQLRYTSAGVPVTSFVVAVDRYRRNAAGERSTDFIPCVAFRQQAEFIGQFGRKGALVSVEGNLRTRRRVMPDGQQRWIIEVFVWRVQLLERRRPAVPEAASQEEAFSGKVAAPVDEPFATPIEDEFPVELSDIVEEPIEDIELGEDELGI
ncbi:MAG: single-stranded DNA-binding protein [Armatimonadota bacterium]|nr:single-stranded DNA-binding protein [Armatimonadota bacterium]MCX7778014.1 single-stranded DNA-binding protein [Armatimonadota bacterium]MDW8026012.1 single-stranded DNA-binding protein [Armatimonadota bacterium]